ncbi:hypothetical protein MUK42_34538 [Musa troglodytarum]|uniref:Uncharacterized protein n=1 Tax=Musa troglodytarum TaxID=320322 RepID=A0A9E7JA81_9LILI|nr:hypothetical protein MUK42_34538 [Musa troglodytarum]
MVNSSLLSKLTPHHRVLTLPRGRLMPCHLRSAIRRRMELSLRSQSRQRRRVEEMASGEDGENLLYRKPALHYVAAAFLTCASETSGMNGN